MQLSRGFFLTPEKTLKRKLTEMLIATELEQKFSKQQIFEFYANWVPLGQRGSFAISGLAEASRAYFNKDIKDLTLPEAALLAGIIQGPSWLSPYRHPERALARRNVVLDSMVETHAITREQADKAKATPLKLAPPNVEASDAPYFVDLVRDTVTSTLVEYLQPAAMVERTDARVRELESLPPRPAALLYGEKSATAFTMNGVRFQFDALEGQKTGAFLDQRENYAAAASYAKGEALDVFCYQGGFALHLASHCSQVTGVDSSRPALEVADQNATLNGREIEWIEANAFDLLKDYSSAKRQYDTIVLDPPAFAKGKRDLDAAIRGYKELNLRALKMLRPGGILVTCTCSYHVSQSIFLEMLGAASLDAHRSLRLIEVRGQAKDHPVLLNIPETAYLKCAIANVS